MRILSGWIRYRPVSSGLPDFTLTLAKPGLSFDADEETLAIAAESPYVGADRIIWASDYPHPEGTFPESQAVVARIFDGLSERETEAVVCTNAARLYDIKLPVQA